MSRRSRRTLAFVVVLELLVGAAIWFAGSDDATAQPTAPSMSAAPSTAKPECPKPEIVWPKVKRVTHATLGDGYVVSADGTGKTARVTVEFDNGEQVVTGDTLKPRKKPLIDDLIPIGLLLVVIAIVVLRLPKIELGHSQAFKRRRLLNWLPLGLSYTFLYFARYNIKQFQDVTGGLTAAEYGTVFGVGSAVYGVAFLLNGPLTDRWGGRRTILIATAGAAMANLLMGYMAFTRTTFGMSPVVAFSMAFALNMYFQSFGAVSIVKVNAAWFHLRERGTFGGIFGILISLGFYFAYDIGKKINQVTITKPDDTAHWLFWIPAMILVVFFTLSFLFVRDQPSDAGFENFDLGDATTDEKLTVIQVFVKLLTHPVILVIAVIELCSGFLRQAILQWGIDFGRALDLNTTFVFDNWGMVSCIAGITGGMFAGAISDHVFQSRRSPVAGVLYGIMLSGAITIIPLLLGAPAAIGWMVAIMSMAIIGVHGMLTATASADFAGKRNTGMAVGIIDGFVYLGSTVQSFLFGAILPAAKVRDASGCMIANPEASNIDNWRVWPYAMIPVALLGFLLTLKIWNAKPTRSSGGGH